MTAFVHPLPFGATLLAPDRTRFRLWAPDRGHVDVEIEGGPTVPMTAAGGGWFEAEAACGAGTRYRYRLAPDLAVPDPASRAQADDIHGPSIVVDAGAYAWRHPEWRGRPWRNTILYELHVGTCGGYAGVVQRLPEIAALGITAIELMPLAEFPGGRNWGYDGVLPFAPESAYGPPEALKALIDAAHGLGLMVFLDVVYNHFGPDGNYLGAYAKPFFRTDLPTPWGAAIDFRVPEVRSYFIENALYWLQEYRFDGLRLDAVHAIAERDWLEELAARVRSTVDPDRLVHLVLENDHNDADLLTAGFDAQWNDDGHHVLHHMLTGEADGYYTDYADRPAERLRRCLAEGFVYQGEPSPHRGGTERGLPSDHLPPTSFVLFLQNHDQIGNRALGERLTALAPPQAMDAGMALLLLAPQIPLLFMGDEWGSRTPFHFFTSHGPDLAQAVRDGRRREFAAFAGFADLVDQLRDPNDHATFADSIPDPGEAELAPGSTRADLVRRLLLLRHCEIIPRLDDTRTEASEVLGATAVVVHWRLGDGSVYALYVNLGDQPAAARRRGGEVMVAVPETAAAELDRGTLPPWSVVAVLGRVA